MSKVFTMEKEATKKRKSTRARATTGSTKNETTKTMKHTLITTSIDIMDNKYWDDLDENFQTMLRPLLAKSKNKPTSDGTAARSKTIMDQDEWNLELFRQVIGPYQSIINSAKDLVWLEISEEIFYCETSYERSSSRWDDPLRNHIHGPKADMHVFVGLFFGTKEEQKTRRSCDSSDQNGDCIDVYISIQNDYMNRKLGLIPVLDLAWNILTYLTTDVIAGPKTANSNTLENLLRFCVTYGLSNAAQNVLEGKYGNIQTLTVNTPLWVPHTRQQCILFDWDYYLPVLAFAAILGHEHVVQKLIVDLGADLQQATAYKRKDKNLELMKDERVGVVALRWAILTKQPDMVKHLAGEECGIQFRWMTTNDLHKLYVTLFHIDGHADEFGPLWLPPSYDRYRYHSMADVRRYRAKSCYKEKEKMIMAIIEAGMPRDLFLPTVDLSIDQNFKEESKKKGNEKLDRKAWKAAMLQMTRREKEARQFIGEATCSFNKVTKQDKRKTVEEFYTYCMQLWESQSNLQDVLLSDFEDADPRWRVNQERNKKNKKENAFSPWWEDVRSDYSDDDEESYGGSSYEYEFEDRSRESVCSVDEDGLSSGNSEDGASD